MPISVTKESFNPFSFLFESKKHPFARSLRTSLWQKIKDIFSIFFGDISLLRTRNTSSSKLQFGLFDYLTFFIPAMVELGFYKLRLFYEDLIQSIRNPHTLPFDRLKNIGWALLLTIPTVILGLAGLGVLLLRLLTSLLLTAITTLIAIPIHLIGYFISNEFKESILNSNAKIVSGENDWDKSSTNPEKFKNFLESKKIDLEKFFEKAEFINQNPKDNAVILKFKDNYIRLEAEKNETSTQNSYGKFFQSFEELNVGHYEETMTKQSELKH